MRSLPLALSIACLLAGSCGDDGGAAEPRRICDGSPGFTYKYAVRGGQFPAEQALQYENGRRFVFIDGSCKAWVKKDDDPWAPVRTTTISEEQARFLSQELYYGEWPELAATWGTEVPDGVRHDFADHEGAVVTCHAPCDGAEIPNHVKDMTLRMPSRVNTYYMQEGAPLDGALWIQITSGSPTTGLANATWPLTTPITDLDGTGPRRIEAGLDADALRAIRDEYMSGQHGVWTTTSGIPFREDNVTYVAYMRDAVPWDGMNPFE